MDIRKVKKLIELLEESGLAELEITEGEESVRISRSTATTAVQYALPPHALPAPLAAPAAPTAGTGSGRALRSAPNLPATRCCRRWSAPTTNRRRRTQPHFIKIGDQVRPATRSASSKR